MKAFIPGLAKSLKLSLVCFFAMLSFCASMAMASEAEENKATTTLQGGVVELDITLDNLRDARLSINRLRKAIADLFDEVNRQQVTMHYNPNFVGSAVIMMHTPTFTGALLPPRKKWVNESVSEIGHIISLFKEDVDTAIESNRRTKVSDSARKNLDPVREDAFRLVKESFETYRQLQALAAGPSYDNSAISVATKNMDRSVKQLDRSMKKGISILQKEAKASKKMKAHG